MRDTEGECITDMFRFQHHALLAPHIMATDCILQATERLADAIVGVQEAPSDKLAAITSLWALLLGKELPPEPVKTSVAPTPVTTARQGNATGEGPASDHVRSHSCHSNQPTTGNTQVYALDTAGGVIQTGHDQGR